MVYLHQIHTLRSPSAVEGLFDAVANDYLPITSSLDARLVGYWRSTSLQGSDDEAVSIWEFDDYRHLERFARAALAADGTGDKFRAWRQREEEWVVRTDGLICEPGMACPTVAQLVESGVRGAMCVHEVVETQPYRHMEYPQRLAEMWGRRFAANEEDPKNRAMVGLYYAKWTNTVAINIWSIGSTLDDVTIWDPEWEKDPGFDLWNTLGREIRSDFRDRFLVPAPFSTVR